MITDKLKQGYLLAKTDEQKRKVQFWHAKVNQKIKEINSSLDELEKPCPRFEAYKKRNNIK
jgi:hypothetical protein